MLCNKMSSYCQEYISHIAVKIFPLIGKPLVISNHLDWEEFYLSDAVCGIDTTRTPSAYYKLSKNHVFQKDIKCANQNISLVNEHAKYDMHDTYNIFRCSQEADILFLVKGRDIHARRKNLGVITKQLENFFFMFLKTLTPYIKKHHMFFDNCKLFNHTKYLNYILRHDGIYVPLSARETEVLYWSGMGSSAKECAKIFGLTHRVVEKYLASAQSKMLCKNKMQAVSKAVSLGIFNF